MKKLFCFGLGYTAKHLISKLSPTSWQISGTHRAHGDILFNDDNPLENPVQVLKGTTHLLISIGPNSKHIDPVHYHHLNDLLNIPTLEWVGYLSATSVYGDHDGNWVDENTQPAPTDTRGKLRLKAEQLWLSADLPVHIFRLGGIYGPNRNQINAIVEKTAKKIIKENHTFSRIHVADICQALSLSMNKPTPGIYNVADDQPSPAAEVLNYICEQLDVPFIDGTPIDDANVSLMMKSFYRDNKRVKNDLLKKTFAWTPKYPTYQQGYKALLSKLD